ncbi:hypothetical protein [Sphingomonas sp. R86520]|uniref:hypothetical protein n=1 Tax=Sphingomonas sp. R86520 TaxID=3093859 RepID=UPI0036D3FAB6
MALAALLDGISLLQGQLAALSESNARIEGSHRAIIDRLDTIDAGQAAVTGILPVLEAILGRVIDNQGRTDAGYESVVKVLGALSDNQQKAREEIATVVPVLEAIMDDAKAGRSAVAEGFNQLVLMVDAIGTNVSTDSGAIADALRLLATSVEKVFELVVANGEAGRGEMPQLAPAVAQILANQDEDRELNSGRVQEGQHHSRLQLCRCERAWRPAACRCRGRPAAGALHHRTACAPCF